MAVLSEEQSDGGRDAGGWLLREQPKGAQGQELGQASLSVDAKRSAASFQRLLSSGLMEVWGWGR